MALSVSFWDKLTPRKFPWDSCREQWEGSTEQKLSDGAICCPSPSVQHSIYLFSYWFQQTDRNAGLSDLSRGYGLTLVFVAWTHQSFHRFLFDRFFNIHFLHCKTSDVLKHFHAPLLRFCHKIFSSMTLYIQVVSQYIAKYISISSNVLIRDVQSAAPGSNAAFRATYNGPKASCQLELRSLGKKRSLLHG